jgi:ABC-type polysaccharide/polyol phosphate export permease
VWALLKPLTMFLVLMTVFSYVFAGTRQYKLDLIIGLFLYEFFQESTRTGLLSLRAKD